MKINLQTYGRRRRGAGSFIVGSTYVGTVVGAGFASGQEVLRFFTAFGPWGIAGLGIALILFAYYGYLLMHYGRKLRAGSHMPVLTYIGGPWLGRAMDWVITFFLLGVTAAMISGAGSTMEQQFGAPHWLGAALLAAASIVTVLLGVQGVIRSISLVAPLLLLSVLAISAAALAGAPDPVRAALHPGLPELTPVRFWFITPVLYVSYNVALAASVLGPLGEGARDERSIVWGSILGGTGLAVGALAIHLAVATGLPEAAAVDIPMLALASSLPGWARTSYSFLLLAEVYTTAVACLFGFSARLSEKRAHAFGRIVVAAGLAALALGQWGFAAFISIVYPLAGAAGLLVLGGLTARAWFGRE